MSLPMPSRFLTTLARGTVPGYSGDTRIVGLQQVSTRWKQLCGFCPTQRFCLPDPRQSLAALTRLTWYTGPSFSRCTSTVRGCELLFPVVFVCCTSCCLPFLQILVARGSFVLARNRMERCARRLIGHCPLGAGRRKMQGTSTTRASCGATIRILTAIPLIRSASFPHQVGAGPEHT